MVFKFLKKSFVYLSFYNLIHIFFNDNLGFRQPINKTRGHMKVCTYIIPTIRKVKPIIYCNLNYNYGFKV